MLHIDFETRSETDLLKAGTYNYAKDLSTKILCMGWAFDTSPVQLWTPDKPFPANLAAYFTAGKPIAAHNAQFERLITAFVLCPDFNIPEPPLEAYICTAAQAQANGLPGDLDGAARALGHVPQKDKRGKELIRKCCIPPFDDDPDLLAELYEYCRQDVRVERALYKTLRPLTEQELADYYVSERINDVGIEIDTELAKLATRYARAEEKRLKNQIIKLTNGGVTKTRGEGLKTWVTSRLNEQLISQITLDDGRISLDRDHRRQLIPQLQGTVRAVLEASDTAQRSSIGKFQAALAMADPEDRRVRGVYRFNGAAATGRYSSMGVQVHNLPRETIPEPEKTIQAMRRGRNIDDGRGTMTVLSHMLRPMIRGHQLVVGDWSSIEARALPWLSADKRADELLDAFRRGDDIYQFTADEMGVDRQIGKVAVLACGYGGGSKAFRAMAANYGMDAMENASVYVSMWRNSNRWANPFWTDLELAVLQALKHPGKIYSAGRVKYLYDTALWCLLPSKRLLCYQKPKIELVNKSWGEVHVVTYLKPSLKPKVGEPWPRQELHKGICAENVTQAVCADILRHALRVLTDKVIGHTHDEIIIESNTPEESAARLKEVMEKGPDWADGLPLEAKIWTGDRYRK